MSIRSRGPKSQKLSNSMTWLDQNCPTKGAFFGMFYFMGKCVICHNIFMTSLILFILGTIQIISQIMRNYSSSDSLTYTVMRQLDIHCPTIGQFDIHSPTIGQLDTHCSITGQLDIHCPTMGQLDTHTV